MPIGQARAHRPLLSFVGVAMLTLSASGVGAAGLLHGDSTVTDVDGNRYRIVRIGAQDWLAENLRTTHFLDGSAITFVDDSEDWSDSTAAAYALVESVGPGREGPYGLLYNFSAVIDARGLCPPGWRVPTADDWRTLVDSLGGAAVAGAKMKLTAPGLWRTQAPGASNESGFSAIPAGGRGRFGPAGEVGYYATWWSSTSHDSASAWHWGLYPDKHGIRSNPGHKASGFSVRCMRDRQ